MMIAGAFVLLMIIRQVMSPGFSNMISQLFRLTGGEVPIQADADPVVVIPEGVDRENMSDLGPAPAVEELPLGDLLDQSEPLIPDSLAMVDTAATPDSIAGDDGTPAEDAPIETPVDEPPPAEADQPAPDGDPVPPADDEEEPISEAERRRAEEEGFLPGIRPSLFDEIRDNTPFQPNETDAWKNLLKVSREIKDATKEKYLLGNVSYTELNRQPDVMRGRLIRVEGVVHRANPVKEVDSKGNLVRIPYYRLWLFADEDPNKSIVVYAQDIPKGFPIGMTVEAPVAIEGLFFKRWLHKSKPKLGDVEMPLYASPLIVSSQIDWTPLPPKPTASDEEAERMKNLVTAAAAVFIVIVIFVTWNYFLNTRKPTKKKKDEKPVTEDTWKKMD